MMSACRETSINGVLLSLMPISSNAIASGFGKATEIALYNCIELYVSPTPLGDGLGPK